jgi:transposase
VVNAIRYMVRSGCEWRMLPIHFPPWQTVYWWFRRFVRLLLFRTIHDLAVMIDRERAGREASPSAGVIDSQSIKAPAANWSCQESFALWYGGFRIRLSVLHGQGSLLP